MTLSSRRGVRCGLVDGLVAEHGPQDVEARPAQAPRESRKSHDRESYGSAC
jgi:hypothetical protein